MSLAGGVILVKSTYFSISNHYTVQSAVLTMASLFPCGTLSSVGTFFLCCDQLFCIWQNSAGFQHIIAPFPAPSSSHTPLTSPSVGCWLPPPPPPSALFWMHGLHVVPPSAPLNPAPVQTLSTWGRLLHQHCSCSQHGPSPVCCPIRLSGSGMICTFALTPKKCWCWDAQTFSRESF